MHPIKVAADTPSPPSLTPSIPRQPKPYAHPPTMSNKYIITPSVGNFRRIDTTHLYSNKEARPTSSLWEDANVKESDCTLEYVPFSTGSR